MLNSDASRSTFTSTRWHRLIGTPVLAALVAAVLCSPATARAESRPFDGKAGFVQELHTDDGAGRTVNQHEEGQYAVAGPAEGTYGNWQAPTTWRVTFVRDTADPGTTPQGAPCTRRTHWTADYSGTSTIRLTGGSGGYFLSVGGGHGGPAHYTTTGCGDDSSGTSNLPGGFPVDAPSFSGDRRRQGGDARDYGPRLSGTDSDSPSGTGSTTTYSWDVANIFAAPGPSSTDGGGPKPTPTGDDGSPGWSGGNSPVVPDQSGPGPGGFKPCLGKVFRATRTYRLSVPIPFIRDLPLFSFQAGIIYCVDGARSRIMSSTAQAGLDSGIDKALLETAGLSLVYDTADERAVLGFVQGGEYVVQWDWSQLLLSKVPVFKMAKGPLKEPLAKALDAAFRKYGKNVRAINIWLEEAWKKVGVTCTASLEDALNRVTKPLGGKLGGALRKAVLDKWKAAYDGMQSKVLPDPQKLVQERSDAAVDKLFEGAENAVARLGKTNFSMWQPTVSAELISADTLDWKLDGWKWPLLATDVADERTSTSPRSIARETAAAVSSALNHNALARTVPAPVRVYAEPGTLTVEISAAQRPGSARAARTIRLASGHLTVAAPGWVGLRVKPTSQGRRLLRRSRTLRGRLKVTFKPRSGAAVITTHATL